LDRVKLSKVDVLYDIDNSYNFPFKDNTFNEIHMYHILEHLNDVVKTMEEIWRISKPRSIVFVRVPHYSGRKAWIDPTHKRAFSAFSFDYYKNDGSFNYYSKVQFKVIKRRLKLFISYPNEKWYKKYVREEKIPSILKPFINLLQKIVDSIPTSIAERLSCLFFGFDEVEVELKVIK
jgi:ubiquinone/menaquinone biosynthesis C-methylase UbiE